MQKITQDLPKVHVEFNSSTDKIVLEGPPDQVQQAKEAFVTFTEDLVGGVARGGRILLEEGGEIFDKLHPLLWCLFGRQKLDTG